MEAIVIPIKLNEVDKKFILDGAARAGTDPETFIICAAVRRAIREEEIDELERTRRVAA